MEYKRKPKNHGVYIFFMTSCVRNCAMMEWYIFVSAMVLFGEKKEAFCQHESMSEISSIEMFQHVCM